MGFCRCCSHSRVHGIGGRQVWRRRFGPKSFGAASGKARHRHGAGRLNSEIRIRRKFAGDHRREFIDRAELPIIDVECASQYRVRIRRRGTRHIPDCRTDRWQRIRHDGKWEKFHVRHQQENDHPWRRHSFCRDIRTTASGRRQRFSVRRCREVVGRRHVPQQ